MSHLVFQTIIGTNSLNKADVPLGITKEQVLDKNKQNTTAYVLLHAHEKSILEMFTVDRKATTCIGKAFLLVLVTPQHYYWYVAILSPHQLRAWLRTNNGKTSSAGYGA